MSSYFKKQETENISKHSGPRKKLLKLKMKSERERDFKYSREKG
jgi:hypothetical protein